MSDSDGLLGSGFPITVKSGLFEESIHFGDVTNAFNGKRVGVFSSCLKEP